MAKGQGRGVVLGYLRYILGFDSLAFEEGLGDAEKRLKSTQKSFEKTADKIKGVGAMLSVGVTAPIVGIGAAFTAMAKDVAESVPELQKSAQLANAGFEDFQRLAAAAKTVGIEQDKLSDIYKDTNDRVGEFLQSGSGEMKDFFEKIAPKVGVTAEQFRKLSGPQALQLYYNSLKKAGLNQQEVTFYMESMADEATALLPLLENNGAAMDALGKKANVISPEDAAKMRAYVDAQRAMDSAFQSLAITLVSSGLLDRLTGVITKVTEWTAQIANANPELLAWGAGIAAAAAAVGPVMIGIGGIVSGAGKLLPLLPKMATLLGPGAGLTGVLIPLAVAVGGVYLAYRNWDKIGPWIDGVVERTSAAYSAIDAKFKEIQAAADAHDKRFGLPSRADFQQSIGSALSQAVSKINSNLAAIQTWADNFDAAFVEIGASAWRNFERMHAAASQWTQRLVTDVRRWMIGRLDSVWNWVGGKIDWVANKFKWLDDVVVRHSYIPDMVDSIGVHMRRLQQEMVDPADKTTKSAESKFRDMARNVGRILDGLYPQTAALREAEQSLNDLENDTTLSPTMKQRAIDDQIAKVLDARDAARQEVSPSLGNIAPAAGALESAYGGLVKAGEDAAKGIGAANDNVASSFADMANQSLNALSNLADAIKGGGILDIVSSAFNAFGSIAGSGALGKGLAKSFASFTPISGFRANGGPVSAGKSYIVGERGPELFTASRSGYVHANGANENGGRRGGIAQIVPSPYFDVIVDGRAAGVAAPMAQQAQFGAVSMTERRASRRQRRRAGR